MFLQLGACALAQKTRSEVQHPLLDKVRQCSANPGQAASFFLQIFDPAPHMRYWAMDHVWCASTVNQMLIDKGLGHIVVEAAWSRAKQRQKSAWCAALFGCCDSGSPTVEFHEWAPESSQVRIRGNESKGLRDTVASKLKLGKRSQNAAQESGRSQSSETVRPTTDYALTIRPKQDCWSKVKSIFTGRTKLDSQHVSQETGRSDQLANFYLVEDADSHLQSAKPSGAVCQQKLPPEGVSMTAASGFVQQAQLQSLQQELPGDTPMSHLLPGLPTQSDCDRSEPALHSQPGAVKNESSLTILASARYAFYAAVATRSSARAVCEHDELDTTVVLLGFLLSVCMSRLCQRCLKRQCNALATLTTTCCCF